MYFCLLRYQLNTSLKEMSVQIINMQMVLIKCSPSFHLMVKFEVHTDDVAVSCSTQTATRKDWLLLIKITCKRLIMAREAYW
jgi:hypothetical protein